MGVAAFLMADIIGVSYVEIIRAALIPALLFYFSAGIAVQFAVLRYGWVTEDVNEGGILGSLFSVKALTTTLYFALLCGTFYVLHSVLLFGLLLSAPLTAVVLLGARLLQAIASSNGGETVFGEFVGSLVRFFNGGHWHPDGGPAVHPRGYAARRWPRALHRDNHDRDDVRPRPVDTRRDEVLPRASESRFHRRTHQR